MKRRGLQYTIVAAMAIAYLMMTPLVSADTYGGGSVQSYAADRLLDIGTIVRLTDKGSNRITAAAQNNAQNIFGVTIDQQQLPLRVSNGLENESYVAVSGTYNVLVSTQGGAIKSGDYIALSSVDGVGMKAGVNEPTVLGRAASGFDNKNAALGKTTLKDVNGKENQTVLLGSVPVTINIQRNPNKTSTKANVPAFLERTGQAIAEKEVSPIRIYLSVGIAAISLVMAIIVLYAGVRNSVISIGRNPMTKKTIFRALVEVILTCLLILVVGLFAVYLLLKL